jgi:dolichol-phosphate mannosyltransferase
VGANLARRLAERGDEVVAIARPGSDTWRLAGLEVEVREADLADAEACEAAFAGGADDVFHLAAHGAYSWQQDEDEIRAANVTATANALRAAAAAGAASFVHTGSSSEEIAPDTAYGRAKAEATALCREAGLAGSVPAVTLRLYSAYGPWEEPARLMPRLVGHAMRGDLPPLADPATARDFVYVDDVVDACLAAAERAGDLAGTVHNVGTGVQTALSDLVATARRVFGVAAEPRWGSAEGRPFDTDVWVADIAGTRRELGWEPRTELDAGLRAFAGWLESAAPEVAERYRSRL